MTTETERIIPRVIEEEMKTAYMNYAMSVIVGRALPDARDGLKPVHRRVLYAMYEMGLFSNKPFKKCARIVGDCMGKYHPHGDAAIYDTLVRMAQDFSLRYPLIKGQGNFGSLDGDNPAAMRYCVTGDTLILTDKGAIPIGSLSKKEEAEINLKILSYDGKKNTASKFFNSGKHPIYALMTEQGYSLQGSANHPILCWEPNTFGMPSVRWKLLSQITTRDYVLLSRHQLFNQKTLSLSVFFPTARPREKAIALPKTLTASLAFLLGALVAEGSFHQKKIIFNNKDPQFYNEVKNCVLNNFKGVQLYERDIKGGCREFEIYHQKVVRFLANLGFGQARSDAKEIPHIILASPKKIFKQFLVALYEGDGSVRSLQDKRHGGKAIQLYYDSKSKKLIGQLKTILLNFGIVTTTPYRDKRNDCYRLIISGRESIDVFRKEVGFFSGRKCGALDTVKTMNDSRMSKIDLIPFLATYLRRNYPTDFIKRYNFDRYNNLAKHSDKLLKILKPSDASLITWLMKHKFFFNKVKTLEHCKEKATVYSVKVESTCHSFVANGFVNHNTEAKLQKVAEDLIKDIDKNTVDFRDNFDGSLQEPTILPSKIPNLLANGSSGIAVGMATNIPPHNLRELAKGVVAVIDNPEISVEDLMEIIPAPDFPTGGEVCCGSALKHAYEHGRGKVLIKAVVVEEPGKLIVTEIPYQVNKEELIKHIADLVRQKTIEGIRNINDESDREGVRVVIDLKQGADAQIVLNRLYKHSRLKVTFGINFLALVDNQPKVLSLRRMLEEHIGHRQVVIRRRTEYELEQAEKRVHILHGLLTALEHLDVVIPGIRKSATVEIARTFLMDTYQLTEIQAKAILDMRLQKLASLEQEKIRTEHRDLLEKIAGYQAILGSPEQVLAMIKEEMQEVQELHGDDRRSRISVGDDDDLDIEDLIVDEPAVVTVTQEGYVKRLPVDTYKTQRRGGKGVKAAGTKEEDVVENLYVTQTHDYLLAFSDQGQVYWLKVWKIPEGSRQAKGQHIRNLLQLDTGEQINAIIPVRDFSQGYLFMVTRQGVVKKTPLEDFSRPRRGGIRAVTLEGDDVLVGVKYTDGDKEIILATKQGLANRFKESDVRAMGRTARGVRGIRLAAGDLVVGALAADEGKHILTITEKGYGKRTPVSDYRLCNRGGKGVINLRVTEKNGPVCVVSLVDGKEELMLVSEQGIGIRVPCEGISEIGRATQGVRVMRLNDGDKVASAALIQPDEDEMHGQEGSEEKSSDSVDVLKQESSEEKTSQDDQEDFEDQEK